MRHPICCSIFQLSRHGKDDLTVSCYCLAQGSVSAEFTIGKRGYVPGESICISGRVQNDTNLKLDFTRVTLLQVRHPFIVLVFIVSTSRLLRNAMFAVVFKTS